MAIILLSCLPYVVQDLSSYLYMAVLFVFRPSSRLSAFITVVIVVNHSSCWIVYKTM